jgi:BASS family bile acid:Na+ symporter
VIHRLTSLFALWTVLGTAWAWFIPDHFLWVVDGRFTPLGQPLVSVLLGVIMLGMGLTLSFDDFRRIARIPKCVAAGVALQFTVMPLVGIAIAVGFDLETGLAVGVILVACCPGGDSVQRRRLSRARQSCAVCHDDDGFDPGRGCCDPALNRLAGWH